MQCIDDLETLYSHRIMLWDGLKKSAMYNQDWLFSWCLQVRMQGTVVLDSSFDDVDFPAQKCSTLADSSRQLVGVHHSNPRRVRALWRAYNRNVDKEGNHTVWLHNPARPARCALDRRGNQGDHASRRERQSPRTLQKPPGASAGTCYFKLERNASLRRAYPRYVAACNGG